jgi:hypothetical protein
MAGDQPLKDVRHDRRCGHGSGTHGITGRLVPVHAETVPGRA